jgi:hypothetical protein
MKIADRDFFLKMWRKYFNNAELPLAYYYSNDPNGAEVVEPGTVNECLIAILIKARKGTPLAFTADSVGCGGGKKFMGFIDEVMPDFDCLMADGIPGKMEGLRYKKSAELARHGLENQRSFEAPGKYLVFKRWDLLDEKDEPKVAVFFAEPDVVTGLFEMAVFDRSNMDAVIAPYGSGCAQIVLQPYMQSLSKDPKACLGMFDPNARRYVGKCDLTFSVPVSRLLIMAGNMDESFMITDAWKRIQKRIP